MSNTILFLKMGGTLEFIDSSYGSTNDLLMRVDSTLDAYMGDVVKPYFDYRIELIVQKDSRDIIKQDRQKLLEAILEADEQKIVVTHGTFTMAETAKFIADNLKDSNKKVIFTGSMIPIKGFAVSDAGFNLGFSIASLFNDNVHGVNICMNGKFFEPNKAEKIVADLIFNEKKEE